MPGHRSNRLLISVSLVLLVLTLLVCVAAKPVSTTSGPAASLPSTASSSASSSSSVAGAVSALLMPTLSSTDAVDPTDAVDNTAATDSLSASFLSSATAPTTTSSLTATATTTNNPTSLSSTATAPIPVRTIAIVSVLCAIIVGGITFCLIMRVRNKRKLAHAEKSGRRVTRYFQRPTSIFARPSSLFRPQSVVVSDQGNGAEGMLARPRMSMFRGNEGGRFSVWLGGRDSNSRTSFGNASKSSLSGNGSKFSLSQGGHSSYAVDEDILAPPMPGFISESRQQGQRSHQPVHYDKF